MREPRTRAALVAVSVALGGLAALPATEVRIFRAQSAVAFAGGTLEGVSLDSAGVLRPSAPWRRVAEVEEPFVFSAVERGASWILGTGNAGRVVEVDSQGTVRQLFAVDEPVIFALWVDTDGTVFAGSSPSGKVYRYKGGRVEPFFDPGATYIWSLARSKSGDLLVATGTEGKLFAVDGQGKGRLLYDAEAVHLRSLAVGPLGTILVGTAQEGRIVRLRPDGTSPATLHDAGAREVIGFAAAPDGSLYAAAIESEAGLVESAPPAAPAAPPASGGNPAPATAAPAAERQDAGSVTVLLGDDEGARTGGTAPGPRSEIFRIAPNGVIESLLTLRSETVFSLAWFADRLWMGTGLEGRVFSLVEGTAVLEQDFEDRQVVALGGAPEAGGPRVAVTTNAAGIHATRATDKPAGTYTSPVLDAGARARFGVFRWTGEEPAGSTARFSFRSGLAREPDATWTAWTTPRSGSEIALADVAGGRFVQWRAEFEAAGAGRPVPMLRSAELSYRAENARPRIRRLVALDSGEVMVPASFNPGSQVYEPAHPARDGMFDTLQPAAGAEDGRFKTLWKKGMRTLRWEVEDPNQDRLVARLAFRREAGDAASQPWLTVAEDLTDPYFAFDETALPDGRYRFRLTVSDAEANAPEDGLEAERASEPVTVDSSPPELRDLRRDPATGRLRARVEDRWSPLREAVWSVDGGEWRTAAPEDGVLDGRAETLLIDAPAGARFVVLRVGDGAWNGATFDLSRESSR